VRPWLLPAWPNAEARACKATPGLAGSTGPGRLAGAALSLRQKGLLGLLALVALLAWLLALVLAYRASMEQDFDHLAHTRQAGLQAAELAQAQAMALSELGNQLGAVQPGAFDVEAVERVLQPLEAQLRSVEANGLAASADRAALEQAHRDWLAQRDRVGLLALRARLEGGVASLREQTLDREALAAAQVLRVHERGRAVAATLAVSAVTGTLLVGLVMVFFFARLSADIARLRGRAQAVVAGDRQAVRSIARTDELGELGQAIDSMVAALARSEQGLEIERRHRFHAEKMASIGALAAGVLHEIGNPIAAIDGLAHAMRDERDAGTLRFANALCDPDLVLHETARLRDITRRISALAAPPSREEMLLNLNELAANALLLARFDPRIQGIAIDAQLDPQLPAVLGVGDLLLQLLLNLLVNAANATRAPLGRVPLILVRTSSHGAQVRVTVADNGTGMKADTLARALDPSADPTADGHRAGLGLPMCVHIARQHAGRLRIESTPDAGTSVTLSLPQASA